MPKFDSKSGRRANIIRQALYDPEELTRAANEGRMERYEQRVDPHGKLSAAERDRRARALLRADMLKMSAKSAQVRAAKKAR